jgi:hypothetical protein
MGVNHGSAVSLRIKRQGKTRAKSLDLKRYTGFGASPMPFSMPERHFHKDLFHGRINEECSGIKDNFKDNAAGYGLDVPVEWDSICPSGPTG